MAVAPAADQTSCGLPCPGDAAVLHVIGPVWRVVGALEVPSSEPSRGLGGGQEWNRDKGHVPKQSNPSTWSLSRVYLERLASRENLGLLAMR